MNPSKVTDFVASKATMSVPKLIFFVTKGSLGKVVAPPLVKAIAAAFEGRLLVAQVIIAFGTAPTRFIKIFSFLQDLEVDLSKVCLAACPLPPPPHLVHFFPTPLS